MKFKNMRCRHYKLLNSSNSRSQNQLLYNKIKSKVHRFLRRRIRFCNPKQISDKSHQRPNCQLSSTSPLLLQQILSVWTTPQCLMFQSKPALMIPQSVVNSSAFPNQAREGSSILQTQTTVTKKDAQLKPKISNGLSITTMKWECASKCILKIRKASLHHLMVKMV